MSGPYRIPASAGPAFGTRIDRNEPVGFRFDGAALSGLYGDTLASALLAAGVSVHGRSALLGRPRGVQALGLEDACPVAVETAPGVHASSTASDVTLREGLKAASLRARGARGFGAAPDPDARSLPIAEIALERLRRVLPLPAPRLPTTSAAPDIRRESCDVAIVGAGLAGLAAAFALKDTGLSVVVLEACQTAGGLADLHQGQIDGRPLADWAAARIGELRDRDALRLGAMVAAVDPDGTVTAIERADAKRSESQRPVMRVVSAGAVVVATGFRERPLVFADNDTPGVMLASTARALLRRHAVAPGSRVLVATASDEGYRAAMDLREAGVSVDFVLDRRADPDGPAVELAMALGAPVSLASVVEGIERDARTGAMTGVRTRNRFGEGASSGARVLPAEALIVSGGWAPRDELLRAGLTGPGPVVHPALRGPDPQDAVEGGWDAAAEAAAGFGVTLLRPAPVVEARRDGPEDPQTFSAGSFRAADAARSFVDIGADVTIADLARAVEKRGAAPLTVARRLGLGLGPDCGRLSADLPGRASAAFDDEASTPGPSPARLTLGQLAAKAGR